MSVFDFSALIKCTSISDMKRVFVGKVTLCGMFPINLISNNWLTKRYPIIEYLPKSHLKLRSNSPINYVAMTIMQSA